MKIIAIGDSHCGLFSRKIPTFSPGAITAKNFSSVDNTLRKCIDDHLNNSVEKYDSVILCIGEIGIRAHYWRDIPVYHSRGLDLDSFLLREVSQFFAAVTFFKSMYNLTNVIIWGVPPASNQQPLREFTIGMGAYNPDFPFVGSRQTRNIICHKFNLSLAKLVQKNLDPGIKFVTTFYNFIDAEFFTLADNISDGVHFDLNFSDSALSIILNAISNTNLVFGSENIFEFQKKRIQFNIEPILISDDLNYDVWLDANAIAPLLPLIKNIEIQTQNNLAKVSLVSAPNLKQLLQKSIISLGLSPKP